MFTGRGHHPDKMAEVAFDSHNAYHVDNDEGGWSWNQVLQEIAKCEVVCANCHRRHTCTRSGSWRMGV